MGPNATVVIEQFEVGTTWEWAEGSELSDGSPLEPGVDWRVARTPPVDAFSGPITVLGDGPIDPAAVRGRAVVMWQPGTRNPQTADPQLHVPFLRQQLEQAGAAALIVVHPVALAPDDALPRYAVRNWQTEGTIPAVFISRRVFARWMQAEGHSAADAFTGRSSLPVHLHRTLSGRVAQQGESRPVFHVVAEQPGSGSLADERVVLLTSAEWYSATEHAVLSSPDGGASSLATSVCAVRNLPTLTDRRTLTLVVSVGFERTSAYLADQFMPRATRILSIAETGRLARHGLLVTPFNSSDWGPRLDDATRPSGLRWRTSDRVSWSGQPPFHTPGVPSLVLGTGTASDVPYADFDPAGVDTLADVTTLLLTELLTEPSDVSEATTSP
jgi:hypothetical protein